MCSEITKTISHISILTTQRSEKQRKWRLCWFKSIECQGWSSHRLHSSCSLYLWAIKPAALCFEHVRWALKIKIKSSVPLCFVAVCLCGCWLWCRRSTLITDQWMWRWIGHQHILEVYRTRQRSSQLQLFDLIYSAWTDFNHTYRSFQCQQYVETFHFPENKITQQTWAVRKDKLLNRNCIIWSISGVSLHKHRTHHISNSGFYNVNKCLTYTFNYAPAVGLAAAFSCLPSSLSLCF